MCKGDKENKANKTVHRVAKRWGEHEFTKITSFQKGNKKKRKKERKKETYKLGGSEFTSVCNQKSLKFHSDDLSKRC